MLAPRVQPFRMHDHQRQPYAERRALAFAPAGGHDGTAVHLDDVPHDREPQTEPAGLAGGPSLALPEALEDIRQEVRTDADTGIADDDFDVRVHPLQSHVDATALRRELHRIGQQVPHDLLQAIGIAGHGTHTRIDDGLQAHALRVRGRLDGSDGVVHDQRQFHGLHVQPDLPRDDPGDIEDVFDDLRQPRRVPFECFEAADRLLARENAAAQKPRVSDNRIERRPQLVREHGEKLVLDPVGILRLQVQAGVLERQRGPPGNSLCQALVLVR